LNSKSESSAEAVASAVNAVAEAITEAVARAEKALEALKQALAGGKLEDVGTQAAAAASTLYREAEDLLAHSEALDQARTEVTRAVRRNPLAALGIAFGAGVLVALLTRG